MVLVVASTDDDAKRIAEARIRACTTAFKLDGFLQYDYPIKFLKDGVLGFHAKNFAPSFWSEQQKKVPK